MARLGLIRPEKSTALKPIFQIAHAPKSACAISAPTIPQGVRYKAQSGTFEEAPLENQIGSRANFRG